MVFVRLLAVWLAQLVAIVILGALRQGVLEPLAGEQRAHQVGTLVACVVVFGIIWATLPWLRPQSKGQALGFGAFWLGLALLFEFGVFHFIVGVPWSRLLADYNLAGGRLLVILWLTVLTGPVLARSLR